MLSTISFRSKVLFHVSEEESSVKCLCHHRRNMGRSLPPPAFGVGLSVVFVVGVHLVPWSPAKLSCVVPAHDHVQGVTFGDIIDLQHHSVGQSVGHGSWVMWVMGWIPFSSTNSQGQITDIFWVNGQPKKGQPSGQITRSTYFGRCR